MIADKFNMYCEKYGFENVDNMAKLWKSLRFKRGVHVDISMYFYDPYALLLRASEKKALIELSDEMITVSKKDGYNTVIANIPAFSIDRCIAKWYNNANVEVIMSVGVLVYRIIIETGVDKALYI